MRLETASIKAVRLACLNFHYAKAIPQSIVNFAIFNDANQFCGVIIYSNGANNNLGKKYGLPQGQVCELVRVALNGKQESTSKALAVSLKLLKKKCPLLKLVVSYADTEQNHNGILYQATNWIYEGLVEVWTMGTPRFVIFGKSIHGKTLHSKGYKQNIEWIKQNVDSRAYLKYPKGKHKYLFCFDKKLRCQLISKHYPKIENASIANVG